MGAPTFLAVWTGYWMLTYGVATVRGCNVSLTEIGWPGKYKGCNGDSAASAASANAALNANPSPLGGLPQVGGPLPSTNQKRKILSGGTSAGPGIINPIANL